MKEFCKDYAELCVASTAFYKKHWKGVIAMNVVGCAITLAWCARGTIMETIKSKFKKEEAE